MNPPRRPLVIRRATHYFPLAIPECFKTQEQRQDFISKITAVLFVPTLKALCVAALGNAGRGQEILRVDPHLDQQWNSKVTRCEPSRVWTAYPTLKIKKERTPVTRRGAHNYKFRQCISCWLNDRDPGMPCKQEIKHLSN